MTTRRFTWTTLGLLAAGGTGFLLGNREARLGVAMPIESMPRLDYFITQHSFSEIENAKASLEALCRRYRAEVQARRLLDERSAGGRQGPTREPRLSGTIKVLERGMKEFEGTQQQLGISEELLLALRAAKLYDRWMSVYLRTLYEHPTYPTATVFAKDAMVIGKVLGREDEVLRAFRHLKEIPFDFLHKSKIQTLLTGYDQQSSGVGDHLTNRPPH